MQDNESYWRNRMDEHSELIEMRNTFAVYYWEHEEPAILYTFYYYAGIWSIQESVLVTTNYYDSNGNARSNNLL